MDKTHRFAKIAEALPSSSDLEAVKILYRKNSGKLGFLPLGAFDEFAAKGWILVAKGSNDEVLAYTTFRIARGRVSIVHLCSEEKQKGYPTLLINRLKDISRERNTAGIGLYCRQDYELGDFWGKLGFAAVNSKRGRGADGHALMFWWFDNGQADLFTLSQEAETRLKAVIDMNILYDLNCPSRPRHHQCRCLLDDWLSDSIALRIVSESLTEISHNHNLADQTQARAWASQYTLLQHDQEIFAKVHPALIALWGNSPKTQRTNSDIRQVAMSIAADADVMLTADEEILSHAKEIEAQWRLRILRPEEFISHIDELERASAYRPDRLAGSNLFTERLTTTPDSVIRTFQLHDDQERLATLSESLRKLLARPRETACLLVKSESESLCLFATETTGSYIVIHLLRMAPKQSLSPTVIRHLLLEELGKSAKQRLNGVKICDKFIPWELVEILQEIGFRREGANWIKETISFAGTIDEVSSLLSTREKVNEHEGLHTPTRVMTAEGAVELESRYWPLKVTDAGIDTWIVPIQPTWARVLFDKDSAAEELFGAKASIILNRENVFYSASNVSITPIARILWYVSDDKHERRSKRIRACSHLISSERGQAKEMYRKNRRLGVFEWSEIAKLSDGQKKEITALRFRDTELFENEVSFEFTREIGISANFQGPVRISSSQFEQVYRKGTGLPA